MLIKRGDSGNAVAIVQHALNGVTSFTPKLKPDGIFGPVTEERTKQHQSQQGLVADGLVGPKTLDSLFEIVRLRSRATFKRTTRVGTTTGFFPIPTPRSSSPPPPPNLMSPAMAEFIRQQQAFWHWFTQPVPKPALPIQAVIVPVPGPFGPVFLPVVLSTIIVAYLFKLFYHPLFGVVNITLKSMGLGWLAQPWLGQSGTALWSIIVAQAWHMVGFPTLVFLAGMQRIPGEILDAVRMETESEWVKITKVVWPLVAPSATIVFTLLFVGAFNWFELPYIMGGLDGSPFGSTDVLGLYFYRTAFGNVSAGQQDFGLGSALAVLIFLFIAVIASVITVRLRAREIQI